ncbi:T9SS sorting signal type C domain-containing protein [Flavobacterium branchiicola]|uniref:T9SS sorting signal type C domain-containing protein n=1 Tax=Flavobacterium branchiicola TaxID=1114875 RepID=A0ABV9PJS6_9FLAO|nr:T9SS sorting signal type C domain-containing protein [Flavobacterium branchiicola]MBS7256163.1 T9SS sorting signal type C domain-containing protein [Flavobacterium branchiicola]
MKKTLLLFLLLLPFFGFSQIDLVKWNGPTNASPTINSGFTAAVSAGNIDGSSISFSPVQWQGFMGIQWPTSFSIDDTKYFQVSVSAKTGYKIKLNAFKFTYEKDGNGYVYRYQVRYSKDAFATSTLLIDEATASNSGSAKPTKSLDLSNITLYAGETLTLRIYGYKLKSNSDPNSPIFLANENTLGTGGTTPTITGTVSTYDPTILNANNDNIITQEKRAIAFDPLTNDTNYTGATMTYTQPPVNDGTVTNTNNILNFTPATNFKGTTSFTYTLTSGVKTSTATVYIIVTEITPRLIIWNGAIDKPKAVVTDPNIIGNDITAGGLTLITNSGSNSNYFNISNLQNTNALNLNKYIEVSVKPKPNYKLILSEFRFIYNSPNGSTGPTKYQVRYSTDSNFTDGGKILKGETTTVKNTDTEVVMNFPANVTATSLTNQTFYIRIYPYGVTDVSNGYFKIKHDVGGELGPTITGIVDSSNLLIANPDTANTDNKTAINIPILTNDENYDSSTSITSTQPSTGGSVVVNGTSNITFTPTLGFTGTTSFTYTLTKGTSYSSATVTVTVTAPPCIATLTPGINYWKGYVYTYTGDNPAMTTYVGTVAENPNFDRNIDTGTITGDASVEADAFCGTVPSDRFYVRYLMQTNAEAGTYNFNIGGDDGVRLYVDNVLVTVSPSGSWGDHGYNRYTGQYTISTAGTHTFMLEYYEKAGASRVSFLYGLVKGDQSLPYGDNVWNVFGFTQADLNLDNIKTSYAGTYVDSNLNLNSESFWNKKLSPSSSAQWQGAPIQVDNFTLTHRRKGFPCGDYQIQVVSNDDVTEIRIDDVLVFTRSYSTGSVFLDKNYSLNKNSRVEIRLREDGGDANVNVKFIPVETIYNGTGNAPTGVTAITISGSTTLQSDIEVCSCTIKAGATLIIPADKTLTVNENITVATGGKLLVQNGGSLLQNNTSKTMFTGDISSFELQRTSAPVRRYDFTFWSSPVTASSNFTLKKLSPGTLADKYYNYDSATDAWKINYNGTMTMTPGNGYIVRAPQTYSIEIPAVYNASFFGTPNNGDIEITPVATRSYLLGNPYPSAIDADKLIKINSLAGNDIGALYFWTHNSPPSDAVLGDAKYNYTVNDYAVYTLAGGVATGPAKTGGSKPLGKIAAGQAFFATPSTNVKVKFTNDMRVAANNKQFYKTNGSDEIEKNRIWLNLTNAKGAFKQVLVGYVDGATNGWDNNYDGWTMSGNTYLDFYSINDTDKLTVQGRALPFEKTDLIPLGYVTTIAGDFTIAIDHGDGLFTNQAVFLEDKKTGQIIDLRAGNYTFTTAIGTFTDRFVLRYTNKTLGIDDYENIENGVLVTVKDKIIKVLSSKEMIKEVSVYDISGKLLYDKKKVNASELQLSNLQSGNQVLIVKVTLDNDFVVSKKVLLQ